MARLIKHEARTRLHERRRDIRRRAAEERRRREERSIRTLFRHIVGRIDVKSSFWEAFKENLLAQLRKTFKHDLDKLREEAEETWEKITLLRDLARRRAKILFVVEHPFFFKNKHEIAVRDRLLLSLPPDVRDYIINRLIDVAKGNPPSPEELQQDRLLRYFLRLYIAYYSDFPCKHRSYMVKITPVTVTGFLGQRVTYYVLRWTEAKNVRADPYLGRSRPVDFYISLIRYKPDEDLWNSLLVASEGTGDYTDTVPLARDHMRRPEYNVPLRRALFQPHWVKVALAKMAGRPELATVMSHCSVYCRVGRLSKTLKWLEEPEKRFWGRRPRRRIKDVLYYKGFRV